MDPNNEYEFITYDNFGDGWNGSSNVTVNHVCDNGTVEVMSLTNMTGNDPEPDVDVIDPFGNATHQEQSGFFSGAECSDYNFGCTDSIASNYDPQANTENGSCEYLFGCKDHLPLMISMIPGNMVIHTRLLGTFQILILTLLIVQM